MASATDRFTEEELKGLAELRHFRLLEAPHGKKRTILGIETTQGEDGHIYLSVDRERLTRLLRILLQELEGEDRRILGHIREIRRSLEKIEKGMPVDTATAQAVVDALEQGGYVASPLRTG